MKQLVLSTLLLLSLSSYAALTSSFSCSSIKGCSPLVVNLTDHSTGVVSSRIWNLGNGNTSTQTNPSATYLNPGTYTITEIVTGGGGSDTSTQIITVFAPPVVNFTSDLTSSCPGDSIQFTNLVTAGSAPVNQYAWGFGNGIASSEVNAHYRYPVSGTYDVTLVAQDTNGCDGHLTKTAYITIWPAPVAAFTASPATTCGVTQLVDFSNQSTGTGLTYSWNFGDTTFSTAASPSHLYTYRKCNASLIVTNSEGCVDSTSQKIAVINLQADFYATMTTVCAGQGLNFIDNSPMPGSAWYWNFGDGTTSSKHDPAKVYTTPGIYSVTFVVMDGNCRDSATKQAYITVTPGFALGFTADDQFSCTTPFTVNFTGQAPAGVSLYWDFGNGSTGSGTDTTSTYNAPAGYTVSLTGVDSSGCVVTISAPGFINTSKPDVKFTSDSMFCPGSQVTFTNRTTNGVRYLWNFGDGDTSTVASPGHIYTNYGHYTVSLTAWDSIGCDSTYTRANFINVDSTVVGFAVDNKFSMCPPLVSVFSSWANRNDLTYLWDFGDGYTDTAANPTHIYFHPGVYTVRLTGRSREGCIGTTIDSGLIVVQGPSGTFTINPATGCVPLTVNFGAQVSDNTQSIVCDLGNGTLYNDSTSFNYTYSTVNIFHPKFILTDQVGCSVPYTLDSVITFPIPVLNVSDTSVCAGRDVAVNLGEGTFQWSTVISPPCDTCHKSLSFCDTCGSVIIQPADSTVYTVIKTNQFGCSATATFSINVDPVPVMIPQDSVKVCRNAAFQMNNVAQRAYGISWSPATYLSSGSAAQPVCTPLQSIDYVATAYNALGCTASTNVAVRVYDQIPLIATGDTSVCAGSGVPLHAFVSDTFFHNVNYAWTPSQNLNEANVADPIATMQSESVTFHVTATSGSCPAAEASVTVTVNPAANVVLPAQITTTPMTEIPITPVSGDLTSYQWSAKDELSCTDCATTTIEPRETQVVYLSGTNQYGCSTKDSMMIRVLDCNPASIFVPNTFTPNGDGVNDILYVRSKTLTEISYFRVFNRWGAVVFESKSMNDGWDGYINGKLAEEGVYVYQVSGKCQNGYDISTNGTVTLVR